MVQIDGHRIVQMRGNEGLNLVRSGGDRRKEGIGEMFWFSAE